jgi:hypothetical protein
MCIEQNAINPCRASESRHPEESLAISADPGHVEAATL